MAGGTTPPHGATRFVDTTRGILNELRDDIASHRAGPHDAIAFDGGFEAAFNGIDGAVTYRIWSRGGGDHEGWCAAMPRREGQAFLVGGVLGDPGGRFGCDPQRRKCRKDVLHIGWGNRLLNARRPRGFGIGGSGKGMQAPGMDDIHWGTVATSLLASVLGSGVTVFVLEYLFGWKLKAKIEIQVARQIAELSRVHERRLELISDLGGKLFNLRAAFVEYTAPMRGDDSPDLQTSRLSLNKAIREFDASLQPRRCFIPSATLAKLEAFREEARDIAWAFANFVESTEDGRLAPEQVREKHKTWEAARAFVVDRSKALLADLHQDFQLILGIAEPPAAAASLPARSDSPTG